MANFCFLFWCLWFVGFTLSEALYLAILYPIQPETLVYSSILMFITSIPISLGGAVVILSCLNRVSPRRRNNERTPLLIYEAPIYDI